MFFFDFVQDYEFTRMVDFLNRRNNTLDIFATNRPSLVTVCKPVPGLSYHEAVLAHSLVKVNFHLSATNSKRTVYKWNRAD